MKREHPFIPYEASSYDEQEMLQRSEEFYSWINKRRTVRQFSDKPISMELLRNVIMSASSAPSGANKQPWSFCVVTNPELKRQIREGAEKEEKKSYEERMPERWLDDLAPLETNWQKPFLEEAPCLIVVFKRIYETVDGGKHNNYYVAESVGLATGFLITAIHNAGLASLTYTPSPMNFLSELLKRPENERPYLLIPVGHPAADATVPDQARKAGEEVIFLYE